jgi:hypothetical protein
MNEENSRKLFGEIKAYVYRSLNAKKKLGAVPLVTECCCVSFCLEVDNSG